MIMSAPPSHELKDLVKDKYPGIVVINDLKLLNDPNFFFENNIYNL